jgi:hypothetical protein
MEHVRAVFPFTPAAEPSLGDEGTGEIAGVGGVIVFSGVIIAFQSAGSSER